MWAIKLAASQFLIALLLVFVILVIPDQLQWVRPAAFVAFPVELLVLGLSLLLPGFWSSIIRALAVVILATGVLLKVADMAAYEIFARAFNPVFDAHLLLDGIGLLKATLGEITLVLILLLLLLVITAIIYAVFWLLGVIQRVLVAAPSVSLVALSILLVLWISLFLTGWSGAVKPFYSYLANHVAKVRASIVDLREFRQMVGESSVDPSDQAALFEKAKGKFEKLQGKDVLIVFVESYGRTVLDNPEYSASIRPLLEEKSKALSDQGFGVRSSYLTSPTVGGMSWLAHATAMSGLWIDSQVRYDSLVMSDYPSLNRKFRAAGWRTVAVMPAISMAWPEGDYFGYDHIYNAHNSGYQGKPFNWVTMPDQYTLAAFQKRERHIADRQPIMAEIALISSHAPWTPVPQMVDWNSVGDGRIFDAQATVGDTPDVVWSDPQRIRTQYRLSIEYALENLVSYVLTYGDENLVIIIFGDHQPAPLVTGVKTERKEERKREEIKADTSRDVPIHLIARDPKIIEAIESWRWTPGLVPASDNSPWRMSDLAQQLQAAFSAVHE